MAARDDLLVEQSTPITLLEEQNAELRHRSGMDSTNSLTPPSTDSAQGVREGAGGVGDDEGVTGVVRDEAEQDRFAAEPDVDERASRPDAAPR